jgi:hypothetical protein
MKVMTKDKKLADEKKKKEMAMASSKDDAFEASPKKKMTKEPTKSAMKSHALNGQRDDGYFNQQGK